MYKPRIRTIKRSVDTRIGSHGFYPGDEVYFEKHGVMGFPLRAMVIGCDCMEMLQYIDEDGYIWHSVKEKEFSIKSAKLIKRHATPKLLKQMKQV